MKKISVETLIIECAAAWGISVSSMYSESKKREICRARCFFYHFAEKYTVMTDTSKAFFMNKSPSTVTAAKYSHNKYIKECIEYKENFNHISKKLKHV